MDKLNGFIKNLHGFEQLYLINNIFNKLYSFNMDKTLLYLKNLIDNTYGLIEQYSYKEDKNVYNNIDNNLFEIENVIGDIRVETTDLIKLDVYMFLTNKSVDSLKQYDEALVNILKEVPTINDAKNTIKGCEVAIVSSYIKKTFNYLEELNDLSLTKMFNRDEIRTILEKESLSINDWSYVYKNMNMIYKSITVKNPSYIDLTYEKFNFEIAYLLML